MLDLYAFYILAPLTVIASALIFVQKRLIRAVIAIIGVFIGSALVFLLLGQTIIPILQMLVFVGGISTYLIVAVATEEKSARLVSIPYLTIVAVIVFAAFMLMLGSTAIQQPSAPTPSFLAAASSAMQSDYAILYLLAVLLFGVTIAGTLILKKFVRLVV